MEKKNKINIVLFNSLSTNIGVPLLVLDRAGSILFYNKSAATLLEIKDEINKIFVCFDEFSAELFNDILVKHIASNKIINQYVKLQLSSGKELNTYLNLNSYTEKGETLIFCSFKSAELNLSTVDTTEVNVKSEDFKKYISNPKIIKIINEIKTLFPFTFIGKEKLRKEIDKLSELFWIKDKDNKLILVNKKFAENLGVKQTKLEGQYFDKYVPTHLVNFYKLIDDYLKESTNCIILEGAPVKSFLQSQNYQTISLPLNDADNNVIAVISLVQKIKSTQIKKIEEKESVFDERILQNLNSTFAIFDEFGIIKQKSVKFNKLFLDNIKIKKKLTFQEIFTKKLIDQISKFIDSNDSIFKFKIRYDENEKFEIKLNKFKNLKGKFEGFLFQTDIISEDGNIENIIKSKGKMFEILIKNNPNPILIYDAEDLKFLEVNEAAIDLYGFRKDEFLQMDLTDLYAADDIQSLLDSTQPKNKKSTQFNGPFRHRSKDGKVIYVEVSKIGFTYEGKKAEFNIVKDITKKLFLENENQKYKAVFENTDNLLVITEQTGFIKYANNNFLEFIKKSKDEIISQSFITLFNDEDRGRLNKEIFSSKSLDTINLKARFKSDITNAEEVKLSATPIFNYEGNIVEFTFTIHLNEEKNTSKVNKIVSQEIPTSTKDFNIDSSFFSSLFHEILTPINVILGFVQDLTEDIKYATPEQKETVSIIDQNRSRLLKTMNSVIEYSDIKNNRIEFTFNNVGITELIDSIQKKNKKEDDLQKKEFTFGKISSSLMFETDLQKFETLVFLIFKIISKLSNTDKIYFSAIPIGEDNFFLAFKDDYTKISDELNVKISNIFESHEPISSDIFGLSVLNLKLTIALLKLLGGNVHHYKDEKGNKSNGFLFPIRLSKSTGLKFIKESNKNEELKQPIAKKEIEIGPKGVEPKVNNEIKEIEITKEIAEEIKAATIEEEIVTERSKTIEVVENENKSKEEIDLTKLNCLYIEDQVDSQILYKVQLKDLNEIKFAVSFEEALPLLDSEKFDFIVMDINLQGEYNGLDALKIIKKMPNYENVPIIAVTAYVLPGDKEKFVAAGFEDFISKPIFREKMITALERIFLIKA